MDIILKDIIFFFISWKAIKEVTYTNITITTTTTNIYIYIYTSHLRLFECVQRFSIHFFQITNKLIEMNSFQRFTILKTQFIQRLSALGKHCFQIFIFHFPQNTSIICQDDKNTRERKRLPPALLVRKSYSQTATHGKTKCIRNLKAKAIRPSKQRNSPTKTLIATNFIDINWKSGNNLQLPPKITPRSLS